MIKISIQRGNLTLNVETTETELGAVVKQLPALMNVSGGTQQSLDLKEEVVEISEIKAEGKPELTEEEFDMIESAKEENIARREKEAKEEADLQAQIKAETEALAKKQAEEKAKKAELKAQIEAAEAEERAIREKARAKRALMRQLRAMDAAPSAEDVAEELADAEEAKADAASAEAYVKETEAPKTETKTEEVAQPKAPIAKQEVKTKVIEIEKPVEKTEVKTEVKTEEVAEVKDMETATEKAEKMLLLQKKNKTSLDKVIKDVIAVYKAEGTFTTNKEIAEFVIAQHDSRADIWALMTKRPDMLATKFGLTKQEAKELTRVQ